jgi:hypothetical protein
VSNPSKRIGSTWEIVVRDRIKAWAHLAQLRWHVHRNPPAGTVDVGDIEWESTHLDFVVECKAEKRIDLATYMREVAVEKANWEKANGREAIGVAVVKRRNHGAGKAYAVMELDELLRLVQRAEGGL